MSEIEVTSNVTIGMIAAIVIIVSAAVMSEMIAVANAMIVETETEMIAGTEMIETTAAVAVAVAGTTVTTIKIGIATAKTTIKTDINLNATEMKVFPTIAITQKM